MKRRRGVLSGRLTGSLERIFGVISRFRVVCLFFDGVERLFLSVNI
jgi:hypothetical protein